MKTKELIRYTESERELLDLLCRHRGTMLTSKEIVTKHYANRKTPKFARNAVVAMLNILTEKTKREKFKIVKTRRCGPCPIEFGYEGPNQAWI